LSQQRRAAAGGSGPRATSTPFWPTSRASPAPTRRRRRRERCRKEEEIRDQLSNSSSHQLETLMTMRQRASGTLVKPGRRRRGREEGEQAGPTSWDGPALYSALLSVRMRRRRRAGASRRWNIIARWRPRKRKMAGMAV
jgi:hypothetical protein